MDCSKLAEDGTPELGMEFNSEEDAYKFYNKYTFKMGFSVRKDYLNKDKNGVTTSRRYNCCKEGVKRKYEGDVMPKRTRAPTKMGCGAKMVIVLLRGTMKYRSHELMGKEASGMENVEYTREDLKRYLRTRRERSLKYGEAGMLIDYNFFGDIVTFDTTYKTNKEYRPLRVFVGFNQHRHFNRVVDKKRHNELIAEYEMRQKLPMVGLRQTPMLVHASETYSPTVFVAFQNEYGESTAMVILRQQDAAMFVEFVVMSRKKYENEGILCGHALKVFDTVGIKIILPEYIKRQWTKRARAGDCFDRRGREVVADPKIIISTRYREFVPVMIKVATRAAMSEDTSKVAITVISNLTKRVELLLSESEEQPLQNKKKSEYGGTG
ncbi:uncharacterized protein [Coffea arabica]|uniref:FAR1 domain-containing protein n=1 Tax=Coffea arabica TaxID=13443 RepID=A0ABM4U1C8_COFAR